MNLEYFYFFITTISIVSFLVLAFKLYAHFKRLNCIKNFADYIAVLEYHLERAYDLIHKDQILTYSLEGTRVRDEDIDKVSEDFVKLVIKLLGPLLYKEFLILYGDTDTFVFNVLEYFNTKYEGDEIRKQALDEVASKEEEGK